MNAISIILSVALFVALVLLGIFVVIYRASEAERIATVGRLRHVKKDLELIKERRKLMSAETDNFGIIDLISINCVRVTAAWADGRFYDVVTLADFRYLPGDIASQRYAFTCATELLDKLKETRTINEANLGVAKVNE